MSLVFSNYQRIFEIGVLEWSFHWSELNAGFIFILKVNMPTEVKESNMSAD